jgi:hypothetical protein
MPLQSVSEARTVIQRVQSQAKDPAKPAPAPATPATKSPTPAATAPATPRNDDNWETF